MRDLSELAVTIPGFNLNPLLCTAKCAGIEPKIVFKNLFVQMAYNQQHQLTLTKQISELIQSKKQDIKREDKITDIFDNDKHGMKKLICVYPESLLYHKTFLKSLEKDPRCVSIKPMWQGLLNLKNRGVKIRFVTQITKENISYCKQKMKVRASPSRRN